MRYTGYVNIYESGYFHRAGKAGTFDRHPGDIYAVESDALADIDWSVAAGYITTVPIVWNDVKHLEPVPKGTKTTWSKRGNKAPSHVLAFQGGNHVSG